MTVGRQPDSLLACFYETIVDDFSRNKGDITQKMRYFTLISQGSQNADLL